MLPPATILVAIGWFLAVALTAAGGDQKSLTLTLERTSHHGIELSRLRERDHGRLLQQQNGVVDFPVGGTYNPLVAGLYYTRVSLGTPSKQFYVQIDTGSDVLWVNCKSCSGCPKSTRLKINLENFDIGSSSTASKVSCSDSTCSSGGQSSQSYCTQNQCGYQFQYGDGSGTSGFYVSDTMYLDRADGSSSASNTSAPVVFGCSTSVTGDLTKSDSAVSGIFGLGHSSLSVIKQLSAQGLTPNVFSHCLDGDNGGILVLGAVVDPSIVYTPLVPSQPHYNVNLESISVNGQALPIASSVFTTSETSGTIIDSGTTLAYLAQGAYGPFINAITQAATQSIRPVNSKGSQCFLTTSSVDESFPNVTLNFAGGASMVLMPQDYLLKQPSPDGMQIWCIGIQELQSQDITVLGDIILKNKIVVYDIDGQRIGWTNYNCMSPVNVSTSNTSSTQYVNSRQLNNSGVRGLEPHGLIHSIALIFILHIAIYEQSQFLSASQFTTSGNGDPGMRKRVVGHSILALIFHGIENSWNPSQYHIRHDEYLC